ncbi:serine/threonine transporter SstT [Cetobacterium ceti]
MKILKKWQQMTLVKRILIGIIIGCILGIFFPMKLNFLEIFGILFVKALKSMAPMLVFFLVIASIVQHKPGNKTNMKTVIMLYLVGNLLAALIAVIMSFIFPITLQLGKLSTNIAKPGNISEVLKNLVINLVDNPVHALVTANYMGILFWAILLGLFLRYGSTEAKQTIISLSDAFVEVIKLIIEFAPLGIMGLVFKSIRENGIGMFIVYGQLISVLLGTMFVTAFILNPLISYALIKRNPYPLVFKTLRVSGLTAFFTRSSAANIPVNMALCEELGLNKDMYSVSIPLGATINMGGAAITITILSLATVHTLGIHVDFITAIILSIIAALGACGSSGVAGGSLLLVPLACSFFGISNDTAMTVVGIGFIIGVLQDSCETALNSSTDVLYTAIAEIHDTNKRIK